MYDGGEAELFKDALDKYIARADTEIEKLCSMHYKGFAELVNELLQVRQSTANLRIDVAAMQEELEVGLFESSKGGVMQTTCSPLGRFKLSVQKAIGNKNGFSSVVIGYFLSAAISFRTCPLVFCRRRARVLLQRRRK